jgi:hypothetical protein
MTIKDMQINEMTKISQLIEASEFEKFELKELCERARVIASEDEYLNFVEFCQGYEREISAGSWSQRPATIR